MERSIADGSAARTGEGVRPERRGASRQSIIKEAKEIPTIDLADRLVARSGGGWRKVGERWVSRCPLPGHNDKTPSFTVYTESNSWFCFGACLRGGDVVDLAAAAWGYGRGEMSMAAADLLREFSREIPERPASWHAKQARQKPIRNAIEEAKVRHTQRRLYRIFLPLIEEISDEDERREEAEYLWDAAQEIAVLTVAGRRS